MIRVPTETLKQRMQAGIDKTGFEALNRIMSAEGFLGLYKGFGITIFREIPFSFIQFPIYEALKV